MALLGNGSAYSYKQKRISDKKRKRYILFFIILILAYEIIDSVFFSPYRISSGSMTPTLSRGSVVMTTPLFFGPTLWLNVRLPFAGTPKRGDVVLCESPGHSEKTFGRALFNPVVRFFSFHFGKIKTDKERDGLPELILKRIIALPGDTIKMENHVFFIRASGSPYFITEYEAAGKDYAITRRPPPVGWGADLPLSGYIRETTLGPDEYFVAGDNRGQINDSRSFGPIDKKSIHALVLLRYWPLTKFGPVS